MNPTVQPFERDASVDDHPGGDRRGDELTLTEPDHGSDAATLRRRRVRAAAETAAGLVAPANPLHRFVAENPHQGVERLPVEAGLSWVARESGAHTTWTVDRWRREFERGKFTRAHVRGVIAAEFPALVRHEGVRSAGVDVSAVDVLEIDVLDGPVGPVELRRPVLPSEFLVAVRPGMEHIIDRYCAQWASAYLDETSSWPMPRRDLGLFGAWRRLAPADPNLREMTPTAGRLIESLPSNLEDVIADALIRCGVDPSASCDAMTRALFRVPGWSSAIVQHVGVGGRDVLGWIAIRLVVEAALVEPGTLRNELWSAQDAELQASASRQLAAADHLARRVDEVLASLHIGSVALDNPARREVAHLLADVDETTRSLILAGAFESAFRDGLLGSLGVPFGGPSPELVAPESAQTTQRLAVQLVCCIDPRSEGLRRHVEHASGGQVETYGYAGFFGLVAQLQELDEHRPAASCPVLLSPDVAVREVPTSSTSSDELDRRTARRRRRAAMGESWKYTKSQGASAFSLAELAGWATGPIAAAATVAPASTNRMRQWIERSFCPDVPTEWVFPADMDLVETAASIIGGIGLPSQLAPIVVLAGHGSQHLNNAHRAGLDCGACGGRHGGDNARVAAALLNRSDVRAGLATRGIEIADDTVFVAAEHETTTDRVHLLDVAAEIPSSALAQLRSWLEVAGDALCAERADQLPCAVGEPSTKPDVSAVARRASDWAQIVPEWGLVSNAAFVIGSRELSIDADLERRVFLHSYDRDADVTGATLAGILGGPVVVAQGINAQYAAATCDADRHGAGPKPLHNPVGRLGVLRGPDGDLQGGLPAESVSVGGVAVHEPMRLAVVIDAPLDRIDAAIAANERVERLVDHGWMHVVGRELAEWQVRRRGGGWRAWAPAASDEVGPPLSGEPSR